MQLLQLIASVLLGREVGQVFKTLHANCMLTAHEAINTQWQSLIYFTNRKTNYLKFILLTKINSNRLSRFYKSKNLPKNLKFRGLYCFEIRKWLVLNSKNIFRVLVLWL